MTRKKHGMCQYRRWLGFWVTILCAYLHGAPAGAQVPSTDIWLTDLRVSGNEIRVGRPTNVVRRAGYDNQPCFLPDSRGFLYTRGDSNGTDIYRYDRASKRSVQVTETSESEYSPTPWGGHGEFCAVRVEADSTQRLWRFESDGSHPRLVLAAVDSVGYFAWLDKSTVALFVVGSPHTLRIVDVESGREKVVARDIGRSLMRIPRNGELSFLVHDPGTDPSTYTFFSWKADGFPTDRLIAALGTGQDAAWIGDTLVMAESGKLYGSHPFDGPGWLEIADFAAYGISGITRIAVSPDHRWIAVAAAEAP